MLLIKIPISSLGFRMEPCKGKQSLFRVLEWNHEGVTIHVKGNKDCLGFRVVPGCHLRFLLAA